MRNKLRKLFRYPLSTIYVIVGLMIAFLMLFDGLGIYNEVTAAANEQQKMKFYETTNISLENREEKQLSATAFQTAESVNVHLIVDSCVENAKGNVRLDVVIQDSAHLKISLKKGRLPTKQEIENGKPVVIIKSGLEECIITKDGKEYININGTNYEVIGIMKNASSNGLVLIYEKCLSREVSLEFFQQKYMEILLNSEINNTYQAYLEIKNKLYKHSSSIKVVGNQVDNNFNILQYTMENSSMSVIVIIYLFSLVNCIIVSEFWIEQRKMEIAIKKAFGYSNIKLVMDIFKEMLLNTSLACVVCFFAQLTVTKVIGNIVGLQLKINVENLFIVILFAIFTTIIVIFVPVSKLLKIAPAQAILQGRR